MRVGIAHVKAAAFLAAKKSAIDTRRNQLHCYAFLKKIRRENISQVTSLLNIL